MASKKPAKPLSQPVETEDGDRVLPGTRRHDGSVRKERRIRPGYTPQEEQPVYQSRGVLVRDGCRKRV
jgi:partner of Y14 and mago protein